MSINRRVDKQNVVYNTTAYYSALKRAEILVHATTWRNLEYIQYAKRYQLITKGQILHSFTYMSIWNSQNHKD